MDCSINFFQPIYMKLIEIVKKTCKQEGDYPFQVCTPELKKDFDAWIKEWRKIEEDNEIKKNCSKKLFKRSFMDIL